MLSSSPKMDSKELQHTFESSTPPPDKEPQASSEAPSSEKQPQQQQEQEQQQHDDQPSPPPNGGLMAWLQVAAAFIIMFNALGLLNAYGEFQSIYEADVLAHRSASSIAWIGSAQFPICNTVGIFTGPLLDAGHLRPLLSAGTVVAVFGIFMLSLCREYYQFFLAQSVVIGVGFGLVFLTAPAVVSQWFSTRTPLAVGIAVSGSSIGAIIYPIILQRLTVRIGFPWTVRVIGFVVLATMLLAASVLRLRHKSPQKRKVIDVSHFRDGLYSVACLSFFANFLGLYVFYYFISLYAVEVAGTAPHLAGYLLPILNAGSFFGRLVPSWLAGRYGLLNVQILCGLLCGALAFALLAIRTTPGVVAFAAVYGFISAPYTALPVPIVTSLSPDRGVWATRLGMMFAVIGLGALIGSPVAGAIMGDGERRNWTGLVVWCGVVFLASTVIIATVRTMKVGFKLWVKI